MKIAAVVASALPAFGLAATGEFSYDPDHPFNPLSWSSVDIAGNQCGGSFQSGIDVPVHQCDVFDNYVFTPGSCNLDNLNFRLFPHAIQADYTEGCDPPRMKIPGEANLWEAVQFHLHTGTDHAIDGIYYGADMHLVHREIGGNRFAVLGYFLEPTSPSGIGKFSDLLTEWEAVAQSTIDQCGATNSTPPEVPDVQPSGGGRHLQAKSEQKHRKLPRSFNPYDLLPTSYTIYTYDGSLTTPPCSEVVFWNVVDKPVSISVREFLRLTNLIIDYVDPATCEPASVAAPSGFTGRPVQPINGRMVTRHCRPGFNDQGDRPKNGSSTTPSAGAPNVEGGESGTSALSAVSALFITVASIFFV